MYSFCTPTYSTHSGRDIYNNYTIVIILNNLWIYHMKGKDKQKFLIVFYVVTCPPLSTPQYGTLGYNSSLLRDLYLTTGYSVGTVASFSCHGFYRMEGSSSIVCESSGNWNGSTPTCIEQGQTDLNFFINYFTELCDKIICHYTKK